MRTGPYVEVAEVGRLPVVSGGVARATVVITDQGDARLRAAGELLVEYVCRATGATLPIVAEDGSACAPGHGIGDGPPGSHGRIVIGVADSRGGDRLSGVDGGSFAFEPSGDDLFLTGRTSMGAEFAVLEFLERCLGVRWLMPGDDGEEVPTHGDLSVPLQLHQCRPASRSRSMMGLMSPAGIGGTSGHLWGRRNRLHGVVDFGHALWQILPPTVHAEPHPEWYPPGADLRRRYGWQPRFSDPSTAAAAADQVLGHCEAHPGTSSISLAVNDYSGFHPADIARGRVNSAGFPDASEAYYGWVNRVTERVVDQRPGLTVGVLAYHDVLDPPSFDLHPAIVPFITGDRIAWRDPEMGDRGRRLTAAWADRALELGWWEYLHGAGYLVPKVQFQQLAENLRFAADHRVVHHFAETWPDWGGGPQAWITSRLLWDPSRDPYTLLDEWCTMVAGLPAGEQLARHFRDWERFWQRDVLESAWFSDWRSAARRSDYLRFDELGYLDTVDDGRVGRSRNVMARARTSTHTTRQAGRVAQLAGRWRYYDRAMDHRRDVVLAPPPAVPVIDSDAAALLLTMAQRFREGAQLSALLRELAPDDAASRTAHLPTLLDRAGLDPTFGPGALASLLAWFEQTRGDSKRCRALLDELVADSLVSLRDRMRLVQRLVDGAPNLFENPGFETGLDNWDIVHPRHGGIAHVHNPEVGTDAIVVDGADSGEIGQTIALSPGRYGVLMPFRCATVTRRGTLRLLAEIRDRTGAEAQVLRSPWTRITRAAGRWDTAEWVFDVPADDEVGATRIAVELTTVIEGPSFPSMAPGDRLTIDRLCLHRLDGAPIGGGSTSSTDQSSKG